jgi:hypothetical protein
MKKVLVVFLLVLFGVCLIAPTKGKVSKPKQSAAQKSASQKKVEGLPDVLYDRLQARVAKTKWEWVGDFVPNLDQYEIDTGDVEIDPKDPNHFIATCEFDTAIYESFDSGKTWQLKLRICNIDPKKIKIEIPKKIPSGYALDYYLREEDLRERWGGVERLQREAVPNSYGGSIKKLVWKNGYFYFASVAGHNYCLYRTKDWENFEVVFATMFYIPEWAPAQNGDTTYPSEIEDFLVTDDAIYVLTTYRSKISSEDVDEFYELWEKKGEETKVVLKIKKWYEKATDTRRFKVLFIDPEIKRVGEFPLEMEPGRHSGEIEAGLTLYWRSPKDKICLQIPEWFDGKEIRGHPWQDDEFKVLEKWAEKIGMPMSKLLWFDLIKKYESPQGKIFVVMGTFGRCFFTKDGENWKKAYPKEAKPLPRWGPKVPVLVFKDNWGYLFIDGRVWRIDLEKLVREDF